MRIWKWNIPWKTCYGKIWTVLEYGISQGIFQKKRYTTKYRKIWNMEYSRNIPKKKVHNQNMENFGIWSIPLNIPGIFQQIYHNAWRRKVKLGYIQKTLTVTSLNNNLILLIVTFRIRTTTRFKIITMINLLKSFYEQSRFFITVLKHIIK